MASNSPASNSQKVSGGPPAIVYVLAVFLLLGAGVWGYMQYQAKHTASDLELSAEAKDYVRSSGLQLADVEMKATDSYVGQTIVEISGKIGNTGARPIEVVEIYCVFRDTYGQLVLRRRLPIVSSRMGGLKPGETKPFRLAFDDLPQSWNQTMPQLVIAGVKFS